MSRFRVTPMPGGRQYSGTQNFDGSAAAATLTAHLVTNLELTVAAGLVLDLHEEYPFPFGLAVLAAVPGLRLAINHLGEPRPLRAANGAPSAEWCRSIETLAAASPTVYMKVSALSQMVPNGHSADVDPPVDVPIDPSWYEPALEAVWGAFGPRRLLFASNWPQIEQTTHGIGAFESDFNAVRTFFEGKGRAAAAAFFAGNAKELYRWGPQQQPKATMTAAKGPRL